ncbi:hypothetical protein BZP36_22205 [Raoultella terrigena]|nr:hypothetical protein BZP36_22205 [Raoultella terrigena]
MGGFDYGGAGDGTSWSSESGYGPDPGGGSNGSGGGDSGGSSAGYTAARRQIDAVMNDPVVRDRLSALIKAARALNPGVHLSVERLSGSGTLTLGLDGLTADQAWGLGLRGVLTLHDLDGVPYTSGEMETGHVLGHHLRMVAPAGAATAIPSRQRARFRRMRICRCCRVTSRRDSG